MNAKVLVIIVVLALAGGYFVMKNRSQRPTQRPAVAAPQSSQPAAAVPTTVPELAKQELAKCRQAVAEKGEAIIEQGRKAMAGPDYEHQEGKAPVVDSYTCRALAAGDANVCAALGKMTWLTPKGAEGDDTPEVDCRHSYYDLAAVAAAVRGEGNAEQLCVEAHKQFSPFRKGTEGEVCKTLVTTIYRGGRAAEGCRAVSKLIRRGMPAGDFARGCASFFKAVMTGPRACASVDAGEEERAFCAAKARIFAAVSSKNPSACEGHAACEAVLKRSDAPCQAIIGKAFARLCEDTVKIKMREHYAKEREFRRINNLPPYTVDAPFLYLMPDDQVLEYQKRFAPKEASEQRPPGDGAVAEGRTPPAEAPRNP